MTLSESLLGQGDKFGEVLSELTWLYKICTVNVKEILKTRYFKRKNPGKIPVIILTPISSGTGID